jgi:hypothetical protein
MHKLPVNIPGTYQVFSDGKFVVRRTQGMFNAVCANMVLEQTINKSKKVHVELLVTQEKNCSNVGAHLPRNAGYKQYI